MLYEFRIVLVLYLPAPTVLSTPTPKADPNISTSPTERSDDISKLHPAMAELTTIAPATNGAAGVNADSPSTAPATIAGVALLQSWLNDVFDFTMSRDIS